MRQFSGINPTFQNDLGNEGLLSLLENEEETNRPLRTSTFFDDPSIDRIGSSNRFIVPFEGARTIIRNPNFSGELGIEQPDIKFGGTVLKDEFPSTEIDYGNPRNDPRVVPEEMGLIGDRDWETVPPNGIFTSPEKFGFLITVLVSSI